MRNAPSLAALFLIVIFGVVGIVACGPIGAIGCQRTTPGDAWPTQPVRLIVPFGAGSGVDLTARLFAPRLAALWHQPVVVDNRPGTDGVVGTQAFVAAKDTHALLFAPAGSLTFAPYLHDRLPYDAVRDVVPISAVGTVTLAIAAAASVNASSLTELAALVRERPGAYYWSAGSPGGPELVLRAFIAHEKLQVQQVRYRETSIALQDVSAGRVHFMLGSLPTMAALVQAGRVRLLAVTNTERSSAAPSVPTVSEAGYPTLTLDGLWGVFGWRGMPDDLRRRLAADVMRAAADRELIERLSAIGLSVRAGTPEEFAAALDQQRRQAATLARLSGLSSP
jgi:tripartite-type tricarboxylate transporter receptor subunit TctC